MAARIDMKIAAMNAVRLRVLDQGGLAACGINGIDGEVVLAAHKDPLAALLGRRGGAVCDIGETPAGMQLDRADGLPAAAVVRLCQAALPVALFRRQHAIAE